MEFAPLYPYLYRVLKPAFSDCLWSGESGVASEKSGKTIALTFDDGPHPRHTPLLIEVLDHYQVTASFFWLGICVERFPEVARAVWQRGHWLGLHGYEHRSFSLLSAAELHQSLRLTQAAIAHACHLDPSAVQHQIRDVRPPNGLFTPQTLGHLRRWNYRPVMWSVVPEDWVCPGVAIVVKRILRQTQDGSLIVLHDGSHGGEDVTAIAAQVIPQLQQQGYRFVTVDELWRQKAALSPSVTG